MQSRQPPLLPKNSSKRWSDCQQSDKPGESALRNVASLFWHNNIKEAVFILRRMHNADFRIHYRTLFSLMKTRRALISSRLISVRCLMKWWKDTASTYSWMPGNKTRTLSPLSFQPCDSSQSFHLIILQHILFQWTSKSSHSFLSVRFSFFGEIHQGCTYLINNIEKTEILWNIII